MAPPPDTPGEGTNTAISCAADTRVEPDEWQSSRAARTAGDDCLFVNSDLFIPNSYLAFPSAEPGRARCGVGRPLLG